MFFLDADDWIEPQTLEMMYLHLMKNKKYGYVFPDIVLEGKRKGLIRKNLIYLSNFFLIKYLTVFLFLKRILLKYGIYDEKMKLGYEDWDLNIKLGTNKIFGKRLPIPSFSL